MYGYKRSLFISQRFDCHCGRVLAVIQGFDCHYASNPSLSDKTTEKKSIIKIQIVVKCSFFENIYNSPNLKHPIETNKCRQEKCLNLEQYFFILGKKIFTHAEEVRLKGFYAVFHSGDYNLDHDIVPLPLS